MICIRNVSKNFSRTRALDGLDMTVNHGSAYGLVGANGAGKTTILKMITGVLKPDRGDITIEGNHVFENEPVKQCVAFIPDDLSYFGKYTPKDASRLYSSLYLRWNEALYGQIMSDFQLAGNVPMSRFSKGMQKQALFALAIATWPDYLILDEPVDGLDPIAKKIVWHYIMYAVRSRQMTVLVSSHNLRELEGICDSVGIIDKGRMVLEKGLGEMRTDIHKLQISFGSASPFGDSPETAPSAGPAAGLTPEGAYAGLNIIHMEHRGAVDIIIVRESLETLKKWNKEFEPVLFDPIPLTLEEVFIYEMGSDNYANNAIFA